MGIDAVRRAYCVPPGVLLLSCSRRTLFSERPCNRCCIPAARVSSVSRYYYYSYRSRTKTNGADERSVTRSRGKIGFRGSVPFFEYLHVILFFYLPRDRIRRARQWLSLSSMRSRTLQNVRRETELITHPSISIW